MGDQLIVQGLGVVGVQPQGNTGTGMWADRVEVDSR